MTSLLKTAERIAPSNEFVRLAAENNLQETLQAVARHAVTLLLPQQAVIGVISLPSHRVLFENRPALYFVIIRKIKKLIHVFWIPQIDDFIYIMEQYFHY